MRFRAVMTRVVVESRDYKRDQVYGNVVGERKGLAADFRRVGNQNIFDSEEAQRGLGWSDEDRLRVERALMAHPKFNNLRVVDIGGPEPNVQGGNGLLPEIGFAPGQELPDEHLEFVKDLRWFQIDLAQASTPESTGRCEAAVETVDGSRQCGKAAVAGSDYCEEHSLAEVS
jgi:hypothetical protein